MMPVASDQPPFLSVVIPFYNEQECMEAVVLEVLGVLARSFAGRPWEVILVDDGSTDGTAETITRLSREHPGVRGIHLVPNSGQSAGLEAGFLAARGELIATLDGDGQNDPADLPLLVAELERRGVDMMCGIRAKRADNRWRRLCSRVANRIRARVLGDGITDVGCSLRVFRRSALRHVPLFRNAHRFLPALFKMRCYTVAEMPVGHRPRSKGVSKYGGGFRSRAFAGVLDLMGVAWLGYRALRYRTHEDERGR